MNNKKIIIIICIVLFFGLVFAFVFLIKRVQPTATPSSTVSLPVILPTSGARETPVSDSIVIRSNRGDVVVRNFFKHPVAVTPDQKAIYLSENQMYSIFYYQPDSSFTIVINNQPVKENRRIAEASFLNTLGITQEQACKLTIVEGVAVDTDYDLSGKNLGLSFCPDGLPIP